MNHGNPNKIALLAVAAFALASCSTNNGLRKFDDGNIEKEIPKEVAAKFEIKDVSTLSAATPVPGKKASILQPKFAKKKKGEAVSKEPPVPPTRRVDPMPFGEGEKLKYGIRYVGVTAATFAVEVLPAKVVNNRKVFHLSGLAKTVKFFELIYRVNDKIESFWDYDGLYSHRFTMDLDESKQSRKLIELYDYDRKKSFFWNRIDHSEKGFSEQKQEHDIALWSQDPLSMLYYLRVANLPAAAGETLRISVIMDGKQWEAVMTFDRKENIYAGGKNRDASVYKLENYQNGELKNKDNTVWISDDDKRYILRIEAKVKVGSFAIALDQIL